MKHSKIETVRALWEKAQFLDALRIVAKFPNLGADKAQIVRGFECKGNPAFYTALGYSPATEYQAALAATAARYGLPSAPLSA